MARPLIINDQLMVGGLQRDASGDSRYQSFRQLENFDIVYDPVALQRRKGWQYFGPTLAELPQQVWSAKLRSHPDAVAAKALTHYIFVKTRQYIYCIDIANPTVSHQIYDGSGSNETTDWKDNHTPFASTEYRVFFGTGTGLRYVDTDQITANTSLELTMGKPDQQPVVTSAVTGDLSQTPEVRVKMWVSTNSSSPGTVNDLLNLWKGTALPIWSRLNNVTSKIAQKFELSTNDDGLINNVSFMIKRVGVSTPGYMRVYLTEDSGSTPSSTTMKSVGGKEAVSDWLDISNNVHYFSGAAAASTYAHQGLPQLVKFKFPITELKKNTKYWMIFETDVRYYADSANTNLYFMGYTDASGYASAGNYPSMSYDPAGDVWSVFSGVQANHVSHMVIEGPGGDTAESDFGLSNYKISGRNVHVDESVLSDSFQTEPNQRVFRTMRISYNDNFPSEATRSGLYRDISKLGETPEEVYSFLGTGDTTGNLIDCVMGHSGITILNAHESLRSAIGDFDGDAVRPTHIIPYAGRLFVVSDDRLIHFTERIESEGALGQVGDSLYFSFPALNILQFKEPITDFYLYNGTLYVFTENSIDLVRGGDSPLNPPPDLLMDSVSSHQGTSVTGCAVEVRGHLMFVTSENIIKAFQGQVPMQSISTSIQSILDASGFRAEKATTMGYDYYLGTSVDASSTYGDISDIYIFSLDDKKMFWKHYSYSVNFRHMHGTVNERLFVTPSAGTTFKIIELETGLIDNYSSLVDPPAGSNTNITSTVETHSVPSPNRSRWTKFELECSYPTDTPPSMTVTATAKDGATSTKVIQPTSSNDVRQHSGGLRILSEECKLKIETPGSKADEIRMITLK